MVDTTWATGLSRSVRLGLSQMAPEKADGQGDEEGVDWVTSDGETALHRLHLLVSKVLTQSLTGRGRCVRGSEGSRRTDSRVQSEYMVLSA
jgi:hypothetical protein